MPTQPNPISRQAKIIERELFCLFCLGWLGSIRVSGDEWHDHILGQLPLRPWAWSAIQPLLPNITLHTIHTVL